MEQDYVSIFLNSAFDKSDPLAPLSLLFLFLARFLPIISLSPFFGSRILPNPVKLTFAISMFVVFLPQLLQVVTTPLAFNLQLVFLMFKEMFVGYAMGFIISLPFIIVQSAGMIIDHQRGGASLMVNDPTIQNQSSPLGTLYNMVMIYAFFLINGPFLFIEAIVSSYEIIPPDHFISGAFFAKNSPFWIREIQLFNQVMDIAIRLAAPALLAILMTDFFLGIANRLAPQVQISFLGMPLKSLLGLGVICFGWNLFYAELNKEGYHWINVLKQMLLYFSTTSPAASGAT